MRITYFMQDRGRIYGAERAVLDLVSALQNEFIVQPTVLLIEESRLSLPESAFKDALQKRGVSVRAVPVSCPVSVGLIRAVRTHLAETESDILHTIGPKATVHGLLALCGRRMPLVSTVHGWLFRSDPKERFYEWLELYALKRFSRVIVLSRYYYNMLKQKGVKESTLVRIPSGLSANAPLGADTGWRDDKQPLRVGMMGRFSSEKNHEMLLNTALVIREKGIPVQFLLAGEGPKKEKIEFQIQKLGLENSVELPGYMDPAELLAMIDVLVVCSRMENLSYSVLEAMAHGRPVICTNVGGLPDLVDDGETGFLVPLDDAEAMASAVQKLASDPERVLAMGHAGTEKLKREFSLGRCVDKYTDLYRSLI